MTRHMYIFPSTPFAYGHAPIDLLCVVSSSPTLAPPCNGIIHLRLVPCQSNVNIEVHPKQFAHHSDVSVLRSSFLLRRQPVPSAP